MPKIGVEKGNKQTKTVKKDIKKERIVVRFVLKLKNVNKLYSYFNLAIRCDRLLNNS